MGVLSIFGRSSDDTEPSIEPYDCRVYTEFTQVTETFIMLDGTERTFTYAEGVVDKRRVSVEENALYQIKESRTEKQSGDPRLRVSMQKIGVVDRESVPVIETESQEAMVAYVDARRTSSGWWDLHGDLQIVPVKEFDVGDDDERASIVKQPV